MKKDTDPLEPDTFHHLYNRGINGEVIFKTERNYFYFLEKYGEYIPLIADTYAYCLMGNHFHFLIRTKSESVIRIGFETTLKYEDIVDKPIHQVMGRQFAHLFNSYTQSINKEVGRTGGLFETPFRRKIITSDSYLSQLIYYVHANPKRHGIRKDFRFYPYSSYNSHLSTAPTKLSREEVLKCFGGRKRYQEFHLQMNELELIKDLVIEFD